MRVQRKHVLAATVAVAASVVVSVGTGMGFAETAPAARSVCAGSVTFSAEGGAPAATSDRFPVGTRLRVTNLDNNKVATVTVTGPSGSCVLLNAAAMDLVREPGKNVVRRNVVERLDGGPRRRRAAARSRARPGRATPSRSAAASAPGRSRSPPRAGRRRRPAVSSRSAPGFG
ncbi:hypothetical protein [Micromonospora sp. WMMA2032]|uniref:hypothetical protein n=1 Tax=Micromonospora sp. WMMA2032 TaxID=2039870 RepID=UPI0026D21899